MTITPNTFPLYAKSTIDDLRVKLLDFCDCCPESFSIDDVCTVLSALIDSYLSDESLRVYASDLKTYLFTH